MAEHRGICAAGLLALLVSAALALFPAAASADFDLGAVQYGSVDYGAIAVDDAAGLVLVSMRTTNVIDEFNFSGGFVGLIPNVYGAWGMAVSGNSLYAAENTTGRIVRIDLSSISPKPTTVTSGLNGPTWVAMTGGRLWVATGSSTGWGSVVGVDPSTGTQTVLPAPNAGGIYDPDVAASSGDANTLFVTEDGLSPGAIYRYDVAATTAALGAQNPTTPQANIQDLAVSPDGSAVVPAGGSPYLFEELGTTTLQPDGLRYPGDTYPSAVAVSASGMLATGLNHGYNDAVPDLSLYPIGTPAAVWTANTDNPDGTANVLPHGIALSADSSHLFAVTENDVSGDAIFHAFSTGVYRAVPSSLGVSGSSPNSAPLPTQLIIVPATGHGPDVAMKVGPVRQTLKGAKMGRPSRHRYFLEAKAIRCTGDANKVSFTVAGYSRTSRCRRGPLLISKPLIPLHTYSVSVRALKTRGHKVLERGVKHTVRVKLPGKTARWPSITKLPPMA